MNQTSLSLGLTLCASNSPPNSHKEILDRLAQ